jgi:hypothetical protein
MKTTDGGANWIDKQSGTMLQLNSIFFLNANKGYVVTEGGDILKTVDGGQSWTNDSSGTYNWLSSIFFTDSTTGYAVGYNGTILKIGNGGTTSIEEPKRVSAKFNICPNPANDKITICNENSNHGEIDITILTMSGEQILRTKFDNQNQNQIELNVDALEKGIYLVKIKSKQGIEFKKMVID